jgi:hypothetical protein
MANFQVTQAKRELIWVKVALMSPSGGGKTYSALRLATGMLEELKKNNLEKNGKILMVNTEQSRGRYYANEFVYDILDTGAPHEPEKYVEIIEFAVKENYPILILDSSSHEWEGKGGCLEIHQNSGGTYQAWGKVTPRHDRFIGAIADSQIHLIATMRGKDAYELEKGENQKLTVKKVGLGAKQREGFEYEFTVTFLLDQKTNMADTQKDNTHLFEKEGSVILTEVFGTKLIEWANSGEGYTVPVRSTKTKTETAVDNLKTQKDEIIVLLTELGGSKNEDLMKVVKKYEPKGNPNKITDEKKLKELLVELLQMKVNNQPKEEEKSEEVLK